jgi:hypothetical protein
MKIIKVLVFLFLIAIQNTSAQEIKKDTTQK